MARQIGLWIAALMVMASPQVAKGIEKSRTDLTFELLGKNSMGMGFNVDHRISDRVAVGLGVGTCLVGDAEFTWTLHPEVKVYLLGEDSHHLFTGVSGTLVTRITTSPSTKKDSFAGLGLGYEFRGDLVIFRLSAYLQAYDFQKGHTYFMPFGGLSIGVPL